RSGFAVDDANRELVKTIVSSLDGLPLAIELASARLRALSLDQLRHRLGDRFRTLVGGQGRHATLGMAMDWSWDLLDPWERSALVRGAVSEGGFRIEAAEGVIVLAGWAHCPPVLDVVLALADKSWLRTRQALEAPRFGMYATVQEYIRGVSCEGTSREG